MNQARHRMPFGAELADDGTTRFRLWAPAADTVALKLDSSSGRAQELRMVPAEGGWFECVTDLAGAGTRYRFHVPAERADSAKAVPDPASRYQPDGVHGVSEVIDPAAFDWRDDGPDGPWLGRPWEEAVFYELHVGTFSPEGTFAGALRRLDHLAALGVTAIELMPVAAFPGRRNWGYDGVLPFATDASYGRPEDLKTLVRQAHRHGLMVFLDVVYNHFGPEGNYLHLYAPGFFTERHQTPWGAGINFDGDHSATVRDFFIHNALFWLEEYRFDGLRLDAVHAIADDSEPDIIEALADAVQDGPARERAVHLVLENDDNAAHYLERRDDGRPRRYTAQWNDDFHHAAHLLITGERDGYYADYADRPAAHLGRCLAEGFAFQGERSAYRDGAPRGEPSASLPPGAFINLLQNHDQVGNRALGERIGALTSDEALRAATAVLLLAPSPPLLFMGQELGADSPFLFFCDFGDDLAESVTDGRRREFARFARFADEQARQAIPDPNDPRTFERSRLDWSAYLEVRHRQWLQFHRLLLQLRHSKIIPRLDAANAGPAEHEVIGDGGLHVRWRLADGSRLSLFANLAPAEIAVDALRAHGAADRLYLEPRDADRAVSQGHLPPWTVVWFLTETEKARLG